MVSTGTRAEAREMRFSTFEKPLCAAVVEDNNNTDNNNNNNKKRRRFAFESDGANLPPLSDLSMVSPPSSSNTVSKMGGTVLT